MRTTSDDPATPPQEVEIKFDLPPGTDGVLDDHPALRADEAAWESRRETTIYFDTPDEEIAAVGGSLRVRRGGGPAVQTLKLRGPDGGPFGRGEWEWLLGGDDLDPHLLVGTPLAQLSEGGDRLRPVFTVEVERSVRTLRLEGAVVELSRDLGTIRAGDAAEEIRELELELKEGDVGPLLRLALDLSQSLSLRLGLESKSDRGWRLRNGRPRAATEASPPGPGKHATALQVLRRAVTSCLASLLASAPAAMTGEMEGVHRMRIAVRRLRTALALFRPHLEPEAVARFGGETRRLGGALGEKRDWDVFCTVTLDTASKDGVAPSLLERLRMVAEERRAEAQRRLTAELRTGSLTALTLGLMVWVEDSIALTGLPDPGSLAVPFADLAPRLMARLERKVVRRGKRIGRLDEEALHDLRKALKRLRYAVEFAAPRDRPKRVRRYLKACKGLQETLGEINDASVAASLASELGQGRDDLAPASAALRERGGTRRARASRHLRKDWRRFREEALPG